MNAEKVVAALETLARAIEEGTLKPVRVDEHTMLVLRHPGHLSKKMLENLGVSFRRVFPDRKTAVLEEGMDITALDLRHQGSLPKPAPAGGES